MEASLMAGVRLLLHGQGTPVAVEIDWRIDRRGGTEFTLATSSEPLAGTLELDAAGEGLLRLPGRVVPFYAARAGSELHLWMEGETYRLRDVEAVRDRQHALPAGPVAGEVTAPMPGTVLKRLVRPGEAVAARAPLVVLESMKMELTLSAPAAGRVVEVRCEEGELVDLGQVLVRLELEEAS
jgi:biotin carboxyl carrier protein